MLTIAAQTANLIHIRVTFIVVTRYFFSFSLQATHITFMCPMRFNKFPLDEHICKFRVGSVNYDDTRMTFSNYVLDYKPGEGTTILDYQVLHSL